MQKLDKILAIIIAAYILTSVGLFLLHTNTAYELFDKYYKGDFHVNE